MFEMGGAMVAWAWCLLKRAGGIPRSRSIYSPVALRAKVDGPMGRCLVKASCVSTYSIPFEHIDASSKTILRDHTLNPK